MLYCPQPVELLPQTLEEFSLSSSGLGLRQGMLTTVYHESERLRQAKLQAARRERERIIAQESDRERSENEKGDSREAKIVGRRDRRDIESKNTKGALPTATLSNKVGISLLVMSQNYLKSGKLLV